MTRPAWPAAGRDARLYRGVIRIVETLRVVADEAGHGQEPEGLAAEEVHGFLPDSIRPNIRTTHRDLNALERMGLVRQSRAAQRQPHRSLPGLWVANYQLVHVHR